MPDGGAGSAGVAIAPVEIVVQRRRERALPSRLGAEMVEQTITSRSRHRRARRVPRAPPPAASRHRRVPPIRRDPHHRRRRAHGGRCAAVRVDRPAGGHRLRVCRRGFGGRRGGDLTVGRGGVRLRRVHVRRIAPTGVYQPRIRDADALGQRAIAVRRRTCRVAAVGVLQHLAVLGGLGRDHRAVSPLADRRRRVRAGRRRRRAVGRRGRGRRDRRGVKRSPRRARSGERPIARRGSRRLAPRPAATPRRSRAAAGWRRSRR